jgi:hypothetical protein
MTKLVKPAIEKRNLKDSHAFDPSKLSPEERARLKILEEQFKKRFQDVHGDGAPEE